jgi:transketolase
MMAAHYKLDNLVAIVDHNSLQISGRNRDVCSPYPIDEKFKSFGWSVISVDGNSIPQLREALGRIPVQAGKPTFVIANTVKGRGVSFMEDIAKWHHGVPSDEQYQQAMEEFDQQLTLLEKNGFNSQI